MFVERKQGRNICLFQRGKQLRRNIDMETLPSFAWEVGQKQGCSWHMTLVLACSWNYLCKASALLSARQKVSPRMSWSVGTAPSLTQEAALLFQWGWQVGISGHQLFFSIGSVWKVAPKSLMLAYVLLLLQRLCTEVRRTWLCPVAKFRSQRLPRAHSTKDYWVLFFNSSWFGWLRS